MIGSNVPADERERPVLLRHEPAAEHDVTVLLLHGMANSAAIWNELRAQPWTGAPGVAWSVAELPWRGEGVAKWSHDPDPVRWVREAIERTVEERGAVDIVVAHSYTATMLLDLLTRADEDADRYGVRAVTFVAPFYRPSPDEFDWATMAGLVDKFVLTMEEGIRVVAGGRGNPAMHNVMARRVCERIGPYGWTRFFDQYLRTPWARTDRIRVPAVVVSGAQDVIATPGESAALAERLPFGRFVPIDGCGHFPMIERAGQLAGTLAELADQLRTTPLEIAR